MSKEQIQNSNNKRIKTPIKNYVIVLTPLTLAFILSFYVFNNGNLMGITILYCVYSIIAYNVVAKGLIKNHKKALLVGIAITVVFVFITQKQPSYFGLIVAILTQYLNTTLIAERPVSTS
jgi:hypothetical protein